MTKRPVREMQCWFFVAFQMFCWLLLFSVRVKEKVERANKGRC